MSAIFKAFSIMINSRHEYPHRIYIYLYLYLNVYIYVYISTHTHIYMVEAIAYLIKITQIIFK